jgi:uncharacterized protein YecT (DUF1311 family)
MLLLLGTGAQNLAQTQSDLNQDACGKFKQADAELNRVYQQVLAAKAKDSNFSIAFREAQRAWIAFRDAHLKSIFPDPDPRAYGSIYPMCRCMVLEKITAERVKELRRLWIEGVPEGDACTGSCAVQSASKGKK